MIGRGAVSRTGTGKVLIGRLILLVWLLSVVVFVGVLVVVAVNPLSKMSPWWLGLSAQGSIIWGPIFWAFWRFLVLPRTIDRTSREENQGTRRRKSLGPWAPGWVATGIVLALVTLSFFDHANARTWESYWQYVAEDWAFTDKYGYRQLRFGHVLMIGLVAVWVTNGVGICIRRRGRNGRLMGKDSGSQLTDEHRAPGSEKCQEETP